MADCNFFAWIHKWIEKWQSYVCKFHTKNQLETNTGMPGTKTPGKFSPMTYKNPCICFMYAILEQVIKEKDISYKKLELIIIDAEQTEDDEDVWEILRQLCERLNYLLIVTDRPYHYETFVSTMFEENGLIVQQASKSDREHVRGNFIMDFERSSGMDLGNSMRTGVIYLPIYKKPWEIAENLDIMVPVGYNTLVVESICLPQTGERYKNNKIDRLDREFRKG